jgi:membrane protein DedA with SNARE-associated domain
MKGRAWLGWAVAFAVAAAAPSSASDTGAWLAGWAGDGHSPWLLALAIAVATFLSEDLACITAGILAAQGHLSLPLAIAASFFGIFAGDLLLFLGGRHLGRPLLRRAPLRWLVKEPALQDSAAWFARQGPRVIVLSRFLPGTRLPTYVAAGLSHVPLRSFLFFFLLAALLWTPILVWLASALGGRMYDWFAQYSRYTLLTLVLAALAIAVVVKVLVPLGSFRGRRLLLSRWRRWTRWEFWPPWVFYPPLLAYLAWLGLRHRSLTVFTAANPGMPAGGFLGESKGDILDGLRDAAPWVARHTRIQGPDPVGQVRRFLSGIGSAFPVVLKPDVGQRGLGVCIARDEEAVARYFRVPRPLTLAQEFVEGREYGVFYYRRPDESRGHVYAITDKRFPELTGDGRHNLEQLILRDPRAVCMAKYHLHAHRERLAWVPASGERVPLVELGTHCRGAVFRNGQALVTPALEDAIDRISRVYAGFHFGRYDLVAASPEALAAGRDFKVIELNGVSAEATSLYDPDHSLFAAYRILAGQWRIAFEIGAANRARGVRPATVRELWTLVRRYEPAPEAG